ncbi:PAS domain-containing protein [Maribrevibacterium harenarium]|uniref:histidine kinase n=1 Tax=Maribrevibacterium harenarium TaxID=2589817 RepID=A0A501X2I2_9GAMM|nr:ATP-binding protein [Maribrevibacterium harenarium]TPE54692.1 PAS domain-containing protein [Maribrevibacterium harenarium]
MNKDQEIAFLKEAFAEFEKTSAALQASYKALQGQVATLTQQLAQAEQEKAQEQERNRLLLQQLQVLFASMPIAVLLLNEAGLVVMSNPVATRLFGFNLLGQPWAKIVPTSFRPQKDDGHEVTMVSGRRVRVETSSLGEMPGQLIVLVDLTETRDLQRQLAHHERLSTMGKMVAALAHQIRTPLSSATLYAEHLLKPDLPDTMRTRFASKLGERLGNIERQIRDMLIFSREEVRLDEKIAVPDLFDELAQRAEEITTQAGVVLQLDNEANTGVVQCNKEALLGALLNLVNNACEAVEDRSLVILRSQVDRQASSLQVQVIDTGMGMSPEQLEQVQQGFVTTKQHGTGLGLMVVKAIARAHHGEFLLSSIQGKGTTATIRLPLLG